MYTTLELLEVFWRLLCYSLFLTARALFDFIDSTIFDLSNRLNRFSKPAPKSRSSSALVSTILFRYRRDVYDFASEKHFLTRRLSVARAEDVITIEQDRLVLYCLNRRYAYFVELPRSIKEYSASKVAFVWLNFFADATKLIRIPISELHRLADRFGDPKTPIVFLWNSGRCGSTLLCKLINSANPRVLSLSEPDLFTSLHSLIGDGDRGRNEKDDRGVIRSALKIFFKKIDNIDAFVIKPRMLCINLVEYLRENRSIKHTFIGRRRYLDTVRSYEKSFRPIQDVKLYFMYVNYPRLVPSLIKTPQQKFDPEIDAAASRSHLRNSLFEIMCKIYADNRLAFDRLRNFFDFTFYYEDFVKEPTTSLETIFGLLNLPRPNLDKVSTWTGEDAQANSPFSMTAMRNSEKNLTPLDEELRKKAEKFFRFLFRDVDE